MRPFDNYNFDFREKLKRLVLEAAGKFTLAGDVLGVIGWSEYERDFLNYCLERTIVYPGEVEEVVKERLKELGRESYIEHTKRGQPPDHVSSPHALAYAMRTRELSMKEIGRIVFDHGETMFTFFAGVENTLAQSVFEQLRAAREPATVSDRARSL